MPLQPSLAPPPASPSQVLRLPFCALALAAAALTLPSGARAQPSPAATFHVQASSLGDALAQIGKQAGIQILFTPHDVAGRRAAALHAAPSVEQALAQILAGSGLVATRSGPGYVVTPASAPATSSPLTNTLSTVTVRAEGLGGATDKDAVAKRAYGATKTDTLLLDTPQSISVITREQMNAIGAQSVEQALGYTAGVDIGSYGTDSRVDEIWVRGFRTGSFANNLYLDGLRPPGSSSGGSALSTRFDSYGIERVEVMRGPSSVLYGQVAPGGLVNQRSKRPPQEFRGEVGIQTDTEGLARTNIDIGGPLNADRTWLYRLVGAASHAGTQVDHVDLNRIFVNPSLTWQPSAHTSLTVLANYQQDRGGATYQFLPAAGTARPSPYGHVDRSIFLGEPAFNRYDRNQTAIGYSFEQYLGPSAILRQNLRYIEVDMNTDSAARRTLSADGRTMTGSVTAYENHSKGLSMDTNLQYRLETGPLHHTFLGGFDYQKVEIDLASATGTVGPLDLFKPVYGSPVVMGKLAPNSESRRTQSGLYLQDQVRWGNWNLTGGLRHDWARTQALTVSTNRRTNAEAQATTGRIGLVHLFDNGVAPYASYTTSFEPSSGEDFYGVPFEPVKGRQTELGIRYQPEGSPSLFSAAVYEITQSNILTPDADPTHLCNGSACSVQSGEGRVRGLELEAQYAASRGLMITGSYTYMDAKKTRSNSADLGKRLPRVPRDIIAARADYRFQGGLLEGVRIGFGARYTGALYGDTANAWRTASRTLFDASVRIDLARFDPSLRDMQLAITASNLTDKEWVTCNGATACFYGPRRLVSANLTYDWK